MASTSTPPPALDDASDDELNELLDEAIHDFRPIPQIQRPASSSPPDPDPAPHGPESVPPNSFVDASAFEAACRGRRLPASALQRGLRANEAAVSPPPPNSLADLGGFFPPQAEADLANESQLTALFDRMQLLCARPGDPPPGLDAGGGEAVLPMMEAVMQSLLSKDLLYPAIRDLHEKFPAWLASHRDSLAPREFQRFQDQYEVTRQLCQIFEADEVADADPPRFQRVMGLMEQIQSLGQPPSDLVGGPASEGGPSFDEAALAQTLGHPDQCKTS